MPCHGRGMMITLVSMIGYSAIVVSARMNCWRRLGPVRHLNQISSVGRQVHPWHRPLQSHANGITNDGFRCIGADQTRKLDGADSMTGSERPRQTNLEIGGATRLAVPLAELRHRKNGHRWTALAEQPPYRQRRLLNDPQNKSPHCAGSCLSNLVLRPQT